MISVSLASLSARLVTYRIKNPLFSPFQNICIHEFFSTSLHPGRTAIEKYALKNFLLADNSIGFLPKKSIVKELAHGELVILDIKELEVKRNFCFVQRQGSEEFGLTKQFLKFARGWI